MKPKKKKKNSLCKETCYKKKPKESSLSKVAEALIEFRILRESKDMIASVLILPYMSFVLYKIYGFTLTMLFIFQ